MTAISRASRTSTEHRWLAKRWSAINRFLDDGRVCLFNYAAGRPIRPIAQGRCSCTFAGSDAGVHRTAALTHHCEIVETGNESWRFKNRA